MKVQERDAIQGYLKEIHMQRKFYANALTQHVDLINLDLKIITKELVKIEEEKELQSQSHTLSPELFII